MTVGAPPRPVLGIVCCTRTVGVEPAQAVMNRYVAAAVAHADAAALLVPSLPELMSAREVAARLDGVLLTGSPSNIAPSRYGEAPSDAAPGPWDPGRDAMACALIEATIALGRPVFAICRGLQELNVAFGGTLRRDLGDAAAGRRAHHAAADVAFDAMFDHRHEVALTPGGVLARGLGCERLHVNSVHFQGVDRLGAGLRVEARADDGVVEAVSAEVDGAPVLGVQWHPEWDADADPRSRAFFAMLGRALRGEALATQAPSRGDP